MKAHLFGFLSSKSIKDGLKFSHSLAYIVVKQLCQDRHKMNYVNKCDLLKKDKFLCFLPCHILLQCD